MNRIVYLMSHPAHLPYLVVSLKTLREHWDGPVFVYAWPESWDLVEFVCKDDRLGARAILWNPPGEYRGKNAQFESKQRVMMSLDKGVVGMYLDADTIVRADPSPLFDRIRDRVGFAATQFCNWKSSGKITRNRINRLRQFPGIDRDSIDETVNGDWPSPNGGIFICRPDSLVLEQWHEWTLLARRIFISDESVLHILIPKYVPPGDMIVVEGGAWNCSPTRFQPKDLADEDVKIWHFHGDSNVRPNKSMKGVDLWWPEYRRCVTENLGGIQFWRGEIQNKHLDRFEQELVRRGK